MQYYEIPIYFHTALNVISYLFKCRNIKHNFILFNFRQLEYYFTEQTQN